MKILIVIVVGALLIIGWQHWLGQTVQEDTVQTITEEIFETEEIQSEIEPVPEQEVEPIVIDTDILDPEQRELLELFGIDTNSIEVTADMITCAEEKIGKERLEAITNGDLPNFLEGISLASCYK